MWYIFIHNIFIIFSFKYQHPSLINILSCNNFEVLINRNYYLFIYISKLYFGLQLKCTKRTRNCYIKYRSCQNYIKRNQKKKKNYQNYLNRKRNQGKEKIIEKK